MKRSFRNAWAVVLLSALVAAAGFAQTQGGGSSRGGSTGTTGGTGGGQRPQRPPSRPTDQFQSPVFITGRVVMETGRPVSEPVSIELNCGLRPLQIIHTDLGGYFTFNLGTGMQSNFDFSASNESPTAMSGNPASNMPRGSANSLRGCELRTTVAGYHPLNYTLTQHSDMGRIDVGVLRLRRVAGAEGSAISVTSLLVPNDASKEFERAMKELRSNRPAQAREHLEKAIGKYDKYAAAWNELGRIYQTQGLKEKAGEAFEKAIVADSQYVPPYLNLAFLQIQERQWQAGLETAGRVLEMDSSLSFASFLQAVGNFNLNQLEAAENSARNAEKGAHENIPQVHAMLAEILLQKEAYAEAVQHMRAYLEEAPQGQFAEQMKKNLAQLEEHMPLPQSDADPAAAPAPAP